MKCKNCKAEMELIYSRDQGRGEDIVEWCSKCGAVVCYYDNHGPSDSDWRHLTNAIHSDAQKQCPSCVNADLVNIPTCPKCGYFERRW